MKNRAGDSKREPIVLHARVIVVLVIALVSYYFLLKAYGYESVRYISVISVPVLVFLLIKRVDAFSFVFFAVIYLVLFDNDLVNWGDWKIRPWYFIVLPVLFFKGFIGGSGGLFWRVRRVFGLPVMPYFILVSVFFFVVEGGAARLYIAKYWLFSVGLIYFLLHVSRLSRISLEGKLRLWYFCLMFSTLWGLLQYAGNTTGFAGTSLQADWFNVSPSGFFSERTWYGQYAAVAVLLSVYGYVNTMQWRYVFAALLSLTGVLLSFSLSALIPLIAGFLGLLVYALLGKMNLRFVMRSLPFVLLSLVVLAFNRDDVFGLFEVFSKLDPDRQGIQGRVEALNIYQANMSRNYIDYIIGNGFDYGYDQVSSIGTAVGAKSANLFLMILHVYGLFGLFLVVLLFLSFAVQYVSLLKSRKSPEILLGFVLFFSFIGLSLFVPAHQYPSSLVVLAFSLVIYSESLMPRSQNSSNV